MFLAISANPLPAPLIGTIPLRPHWHQLEHSSNSAWFIIRSIASNNARPKTLLFAFEADVVAHLTSRDETPMTLICMTPEPNPARGDFGAVPIAEVWLTKDRYAKDEPCIMFMGLDGAQYSGRLCRLRRDGLRRVQLIAKLQG